MPTMLNGTEKAVVETMRMRLTTDQALQYLKDGHHLCPKRESSYELNVILLS